MSIRTTVVGSYPKVIEDNSDNLPSAIDRWQRQLIDDKALNQEVETVIRRVIKEHDQAGLDLVTDGQIRWEDMPHALARSTAGIKRGALRRLFDNNVYYRRLEVGDKVSWTGSEALKEFQFASKAASKPVKVALPGPLTLVISTELAQGQTPQQLLSLYADLLRQEVAALVDSGVKEIQLDEPALTATEPLLREVLEAINKIFTGVKARRWLALYFQDVSEVLPKLSGLTEVDVLSLDLISARTKNPELLNKVTQQLQSGSWSGEVALGLVDARNTKLESAKEIQAELAGFLKAVPVERLWLTTNCGLEFLPHEAAQKKLQLLKAVANGA